MKKVNVRGLGRLHRATVKKVRNIGGSCYICLPKPYCEKHDIEPGMEMSVIINGDEVRLIPLKGE